MVPDPPAHLDDATAAVWRELVDVLGPVERPDVVALEVLANLVTRYRRDPAGMGVTRVSVMVTLIGRFGGTPADRQRLAPLTTSTGVNPFAEFAR